MLTMKAVTGFACLAFTSGLVLHQGSSKHGEEVLVLIEGKQENWVGVDDGLGYCYEVKKNAGNEYLYGCIGGSPCSQGSSTGMNVICKRGRGNCDSCSKRGFKNAGGDDTYPKPYGGKGNRGYVKFHVNELGRKNLAALKARPGVEDQWKFYAQMFPHCKLKAPKKPKKVKPKCADVIEDSTGCKEDGGDCEHVFIKALEEGHSDVCGQCAGDGHGEVITQDLIDAAREEHPDLEAKICGQEKKYFVLSGSATLCDDVTGYVAAKNAAECEALAALEGGTFSGNAGADVVGCMRWVASGKTTPKSWAWSDGPARSASCGGDTVSGTRGYECLCAPELD